MDNDMKQRTIHTTDEQWEALARESRRQGMASLSELIRYWANQVLEEEGEE